MNPFLDRYNRGRRKIPKVLVDMSRDDISIERTAELCAKQTTTPGCIIKLMDKDESEISQVANLLADAFLQREPLSRTLAATDPSFPESLRAYAQELSLQSAEGGLSSIATTADGTVIGLLMLEPWEETKPAPCTRPGMGPFFDILTQMHDKFVCWRHSSGRNKDEDQGSGVVELTMATVHPDFEGCGIANSLVMLAIMNAHKLGYKELMTKTTSNSRLGWKRAGCVVLAKIAYSDYHYAGTRPFLSIDEPPTAEVVWGDLVSLAMAYRSQNMVPQGAV